VGCSSAFGLSVEKLPFGAEAIFPVLSKCSRKSVENTKYDRLRKIERGDRQERLFHRIKGISGFLQRYDFSAQHAQRVFQEFFNRIGRQAPLGAP
jgi:hypothetical protein